MFETMVSSEPLATFEVTYYEGSHFDLIFHAFFKSRLHIAVGHGTKEVYHVIILPSFAVFPYVTFCDAFKVATAPLDALAM